MDATPAREYAAELHGQRVQVRVFRSNYVPRSQYTRPRHPLGRDTWCVDPTFYEAQCLPTRSRGNAQDPSHAE